MSKLDKDKEKKGKNKKEKKKAAKGEARPAQSAESSGQLVAIEGTRGPEVLEAAQKVLRALTRSGKMEGGVSRWDASNTFYEMRLVKSKFLTPTPRTLLLLYASDLLFRLRWEIKPGLQEGYCVVAAPYVESAKAFGRAAGIPQEWLDELFAFAPKPKTTYHIKEKNKGDGKIKPQAGYAEFCTAALTNSSPDWDAKDIRARMLEYFGELEEGQVVKKLGKKALK